MPGSEEVLCVDGGGLEGFLGRNCKKNYKNLLMDWY